MGKIASEALEGASGKIGGLIFYNVNGKTFCRRCPKTVVKPGTPAQLLQQQRQRGVQTLFRSVKGQLLGNVANLAALLQGRRSGYHLFLAWNMNAFGADDYIDYSKLRFADGSLQLPNDFRVQEVQQGQAKLAWEDHLGSFTSRGDDRLMVAAIAPDEPYRVQLLEGVDAVRKDGVATIRFSQPLAGSIHLYCFFASATGSAYSLDRYFKIESINV